MIRYYAFALSQKLLSKFPGGEALYRRVGEHLYSDKRGYEEPLFEAGVEAVGQALRRTAPEARVLDLGTGWYYKDALLYALTGQFEVHAYDIKHIARMAYVRNYLHLLSNRISCLAESWDLPETPMRSRLRKWEECNSLDELRQVSGIRLCISPPVNMPYTENSLDFISSYCVLPHIDPVTLEVELDHLTQALKPSGWMHHLIGYDDHFSFKDATASPFHYYRYEDKAFQIFFSSRLQYQNRWLWSDYQSLFHQLGLEVVEEVADITPASLSAAKDVAPHLARRFRGYPLDEMARIHSTVLLNKLHVAASPNPPGEESKK